MQETKRMASGKKMIIVPGHGVCTNPSNPLVDSSWVGIFPGEGPLYCEHIQQGVAHASEDPDALLVFSGGQTRESAGERSEAESYYEIAMHFDWWGYENTISRTLKEEYARDSFENLLFSVAMFRREIGTWPCRIIVVGWEFKRERFDLHRQAIRWPRDRFEYVGVNNPIREALSEAKRGEAEKARSARKDLFVTGPEWTSQRMMRDPFNRKHPYRNIDPELDYLFDFLERNSYCGDFPWLR